MFRFVVTRLRWLARVPLFPQLFDAVLLTWTLLVHRPRLQAMEALEAAMRLQPEVRVKMHRLGGMEFSSAAGELGHVHGNGLVDIFVGRSARGELVTSGQALPHHLFPNSGWISYHLETPAHVAGALRLLDHAVETRRRAPAATKKTRNSKAALDAPWRES